VSCPIGVLCIIFESRPDAAVQIATLALKSGNAVILKGGTEALESNKTIVACLQDALRKTDISPDIVQLVESREDIKELLTFDEYIDLIIPRGSKQLVQYIKQNTRIPVMGHADGICSVYIDQDADLEKAWTIAVDAKTQVNSIIISHLFFFIL
jgi:glutamate-5-semialdehyde dehydrogenase